MRNYHFWLCILILVIIVAFTIDMRLSRIEARLEQNNRYPTLDTYLTQNQTTYVIDKVEGTSIVIGDNNSVENIIKNDEV